MKVADLQLTSVFLGNPIHGRGWLDFRAFASIGDRRFEFAQLRREYGPQRVEVYDYPKDWGGVARFCGYMPDETGAKLLELGKQFARDVAIQRGEQRSFGLFEAPQ